MKKILLLFIAGFLILIPSYNAQETFYEGEFIENVYVKKEQQGKIRYQQAKILKRSSDYQFVYCLEPWEILNDKIIYEENIDINTLDDAILERLSLLAYYGYGYNNHNDKSWYYITQVAMWRLIDQNSSFYFTDALNGSYTDKYEEQIAELYNLVEHHYLLPDFGNSFFNMLNNQNLVLTDKNNILSKYEIISEVNYYSQENKLVVEPLTKNDTKIITFIKKDKKYSHPPILYTSNKSQNVLSVGHFKEQKISITIKGDDTVFNIIKISSDEENIDFTGTKFKVYNQQGTFNKIITVEENIAFIRNLPIDTYYIQEISTIDGYEIDKTIHQLEIKEKIYISEIVIANSPKTTKIRITKADDHNIPIINNPATFKVTNLNTNKVLFVTTNNDGSIILDNILIGKYEIEEIEAPKGYQKSSSKQTINVSKEHLLDDINMFEILFTNIKLVKVPKTSQNEQIIYSVNYYEKKKYYF